MGKEAIGMNLFSARMDKELTQRELGLSVGVGQSTVADWERGAYLPSLLRFRNVCLILDVSPSLILGVETE